MSPSRARHCATLSAMRRHAEADTVEGRVAKDVAAKFQATHCISEDEFVAWRVATEDQARTIVELPGWERPWLFGILSAVGVIYRCVVILAPGPKVVVRGPKAGQAARRAEDVRRRVDAIVERTPEFGALPVRVPGVYAATAASYSSMYFTIRQLDRTTTLASTAGVYLDDTYRSVLVRNMLVDEVKAAVAETAKAARAQTQGAACPGASPPPGEPVPSSPPPQPDPEEAPPDSALLAAIRRLDEANAVLARVLQSRPAWAAENPEEAPASLACMA